MNSRAAHFIGGPRDGQRMMLEGQRDYYDVAMIPKMSSAAFGIDPMQDVIQTIDKFTYRMFPIGYQMQVYIPATWFENHDDLHGYVMQRLLAGYTGNTRT